MITYDYFDMLKPVFQYSQITWDNSTLLFLTVFQENDSVE